MGVPWTEWLRDDFEALRLQRRVRQLAGWMVHCQEGMVLPKREQGMPSRSRWLCLSSIFVRILQWSVQAHFNSDSVKHHAGHSAFFRHACNHQSVVTVEPSGKSMQ